ncbi:MAG: hypothetical protein HOW73_34935 [Polyangiaceae bacterium]|nr:hypothetical protein [Polyangiaceae bacterium]
MMVRGIIAGLLAAGLLLTPIAGAAAPSAQDKAAAKTSWAKGKQLEKLGKTDEAVAALRAAVERDPKAQYQLDFARALAKTDALREAVKVAEAVTTTKEPNAQRAKAAAAQLKKDLEAKIPSLKVRVRGADVKAATVQVDGQAFEVDKELPLDPGEHKVTGKVGDQPEVTETIDLAVSEHKVVSLDLAPKVAAKAADKDEEKEGGGGNMAPAAVLYGIGGAGLAAGAVLGVLAFNKTGEVEELCGGSVCPPEYADDVALAQDYGTASTVAFALGGLCAAAGIILTVTVGIDHGDDGDDEKTDAASLVVRPYVGPGTAGVVGVF